MGQKRDSEYRLSFQGSARNFSACGRIAIEFQKAGAWLPGTVMNWQFGIKAAPSCACANRPSSCPAYTRQGTLIVGSTASDDGRSVSDAAQARVSLASSLFCRSSDNESKSAPINL